VGGWGGGGGSGNPNFFLHISFSWVEMSLYVEFHPPGLPRSGRSMVGDKSNDKNSIELMASLASSSS
jgi:hypothetical protein